MSFQTKKLYFKPGEILPCIRALEQKDEVRNVNISRDGLCVGKLLGKNCVLRRKTRGKHLCKGRTIIPSAKMAYVAPVER